jgi:hypothetical protein
LQYFYSDCKIVRHEPCNQDLAMNPQTQTSP